LTQVQSTSRSEAISLRHMAPSVIAEATSLADRSIAESQPPRDLKVPHYLTANYWWAYVHPRAIWLFERQWLVNLILWGNYKRLRDAAMSELGDVLPGATLQVACVYGDLTGKLSSRVAAGGGRLDIVDVAADAAGKPAPQAAVRRAGAIAGDGFGRSQVSGREL